MIFFEVTALIDVPCRRNVNRFTAMRKNKLAVYLWCSVAPISRRKSILIHSWVYWRITDKSSSNQKHTRSLNIGISVREKTPLCASSAVLKYDSLIAYLFVCHSSIQRDIRDFVCIHSDSETRTTQDQFLTNTTYVCSVSHDYQYTPITTKCTLLKDLTFCLWAWILMINHLSNWSKQSSEETTLLSINASRGKEKVKVPPS